MGKALEIFLGILTAMGGFVEIGELTFALNAGVHFGYGLLWVVAVGTLGIIVYCEMAGRVAAVRKQPVFNLIRERAGFGAGLVTLVAANAVNLLTCAAEIGGVALVWQLLGGWPYRLLVVLALAFLLASVWLLKFEWIERVFGLGGLLLVVFLVVALREGPDWPALASGFVPRVSTAYAAPNPWLFPYYAVALFSSILLPYETYFYAAGAIEDGWKPGDIPLNRVIVGIGFTLGSLLAVSLIAIGAQYFAAAHGEPQLPGLAAVAAGAELGVAGGLIAIGGMFFAFAGAAIETALSGAYNLAHFLGWPWGKAKKPREAGRFSFAWIVIFSLAALIISTGIDPVQVVEYSIVFSVIILPFTYFPLLAIASDKRVMGEHANGRVANALGWTYLTLVSAAALAAIPLLIATHGGRG
jgi:Mn2+/Fe2+ NRAMP family transporter